MDDKEEAEREALTRALILQDQQDTARANGKDWADFTGRRDAYAEKYGANVAKVMFRDEERTTLDRMNARTQAQDAKELERWDQFHTGNPIVNPISQQPSQPASLSPSPEPKAPAPKMEQPDFTDKAAALLAKMKQARQERQQDRDGYEY